MNYKITPQIKELMIQAIRDNGGNQAEFSRCIGIGPVDIHRYVTGKIENISLETYLKLVKYFPELNNENFTPSNLACAITGLNKCPYDDASPAIRYLLERVNKLDKKQIEKVLKYIVNLDCSEK